ncbi:MAG: fibronectin type III domain-containing protein [Candidatus Yanofskybacteria bacterium]|nr:fibronectin type III domain-containing protein [Candidatus Yanofskybacteria bacterium]
MKWTLAIIGIVYALSSIVHAAPYTEFAPDYAQSLLVASSETPSEVFLPLNDHFSGMDLWLSNAGNPGDATFALFNPSGTLVGERAITIPAIADSETGARVHVALPAQIAVSGNQAYRMRITATEPHLRLYYATAQKLLAHNGAPLPAYTNGIARLGDEDTSFSFLYALYESTETTPPQISGVTITQINPTQATMAFSSNEPVDRRIEYNTASLDWTGQYASCLTGVQTCTATLAVTQGTYTYTLTIRDSWGNQSSATGTFTISGTEPSPSPTQNPSPTGSPTPTTSPTPTPTPDTAVPIITNARTVTMTPTSATFAWTTNEPATSTVVAQLTPLLITVGGNSDATLELEHYITVNNLPPDTYLRATITSNDASGNAGKTTLNILTPKELAVTPTPSTPPQTTQAPMPTPSALAASDTGGQPNIQWPPAAPGQPTNEYRIDVFDGSGNLVRSVAVPADQYTATLRDLPDSEYRVIVYANHGGAFEKVAPPTTVRVHKPSPIERVSATAPYALASVAIAIGITIGVLKLRRPKNPAAIPASPPNQSGGAQPNPPPVG